MKESKELIGETWFNELSGEEKDTFCEKYRKAKEKDTFCKKYRKAKEKILPIESEDSGIYYALKKTPLNKVKVLIIGQDPYLNKEYAHGLAFSIHSEEIPENSCLNNIFSKIKKNYPEAIHTTGNLNSWAEQGVLLLNMALTYSKNETLYKRIKFWSPIIDIIINKLIERQKPLVVILWGRKANNIKQFSPDKDKEYEKNNILILRSSHPSNQGKSQTLKLNCVTIKSFKEESFFKKTNCFLKCKSEKEIDWNTCKYSKTCYKYHKTCFLSSLKK